MNGIRGAWTRLAHSPHRFALSAAIGLLAVAGGIGFAIAVNGVRQPGGTGASPSTIVAVDASESEAGSPPPSPTMTASPTPSPTASPTQSPTQTPRPTPTPTPSPMPIPTAAPTPTPQPPPAPGACDTFTFSPASEVSVDSLAELQDGMVGTWAGCLTTPWVPRYWVIITFRADGTYSGHAEEGAGPAFYYGTDEDLAEKRYELNDLQDDLEGIGQIDIVFWEGNTNRGELRNIRLTGNELEFEFFHRGEYGPLLYQLYRTAPGA